ncbi:MAG: SixA phosphatase family protein [Acidimicrobiales bacterium]
MRYLTIVRHAKATPASPGGDDFARPLSGRGREQCRRLREWARDPDALGRFGPTVALVSAARRTTETFERAFAGTPFVSSVTFGAAIYNGRRAVDADDLLAQLATIDPGTSSLLVVAHNPTVLECVLSLTTRIPTSLREGHYPLGGAYVLELPDDQVVGQGPYALVASYLPDQSR